MLNRALPDLVERDLDQLVQNSVAEGRDLEFKRDWPGPTDDDKKEFLADVSSLANSQGGDLVFGIDENKDGVATAIIGLDAAGLDAAILRLESIIRDGLNPRLSVRMQWVPLAGEKGVLVMRVPGSLAAPHRVVFRNSGRFFRRNSRGKYEMDVHELRHAFTQSEELPKRLREFHFQAIGNAEGRDFPYRVCPVPIAVLSLMPVGLLRERRDLNITVEESLLPVQLGGNHNLPILEGLLWHTTVYDESCVASYTLTHRTGRIDAAWAIGADRKIDGYEKAMLVWASKFEAGLSDMARNGATRLQAHGLEGPWVLMVTILNLKGAFMVLRNNSLSRDAWQEQAPLPELIVETVTEECLLPLYKGLWLLFGLTRPDNFKANDR